MFACMAGTAIISWISVGEYSKGIEHVIGGNENIRIASLVVFALLGFPLAVSISVLLVNACFLVLLPQKYAGTHLVVCYRLPTAFPFQLQLS